MISEHASPLGDGGQQTHVADLSAALAELGHEVRVYTRRDDSAVAEEVTTPGGIRVVHVPAGPAHQIPPDLLLPHIGEFARWLEQRWRSGGWSPDVVHAHYWTSGLAAVTAARQFGIPVVQSFHELGEIEAGGGKPSRSGYERALGRAVDRVVAQTQDEVRGLVRIGVPRARLTVVPAGVDSVRFSPEGPVADRDPERPRILSVGKLVECKGFGDVIQAMRYVPDAEVVVVGGPSADQLPADPGARTLRALAARLHVDDRFRLIGRVPSADLSDTVVDGLTGELVPARDPQALGGALRRLVNDKVRRFAYATAALDRARQAYSWKRVAAQIGSVYATVTGLRRSADREAIA